MTLKRRIVDSEISKRRTKISYNDEYMLANVLSSLSRWGHGVGFLQIQKIASEYIKSIGQEDLFKNGQVTRDWFCGFTKRWNHVFKYKVPEKIAKNRAAACNPEAIIEFFKIVRTIYDEHDLHDKPHLIFNVDETGFDCSPLSEKIICANDSNKTKKQVAYQITSNNTKTRYTVAACCSASGMHFSPFIVYKCKLFKT